VQTLTAEEIDHLLAEPEARVYLVGAGGCGVSGLGHALLDAGYRVAGSDLAPSGELDGLRARGAQVEIGHRVEALRVFAPRLVVYSSAVRAANAELNEARSLGIPIARRAAVLAALMRLGRGICVAGMHGKTTTTALLVYAMERLGWGPSYAVGGSVPQLERHARFRVPEGAAVAPWFVAETDESDGTLREFHPEHAILLNVDAEHLDYFGSFEAVCREFQAFAEQATGLVMYCGDDPTLPSLLAKRPGAIAYGFHPLAGYRIGRFEPIAAGAGRRFELWRRGEFLGWFPTLLLGEKNVSNTAAVAALLLELGVAPGAAAAAMDGFRGAARRQEEVFRDGRFRVFDDYGHHPDEIAATLRGLRTLNGRRLLVAFQPHRYTRTQLLLDRFASCFREADRLWLTEIYPASEPEIPGIDGRVLAGVVRAQGQEVEFVERVEDLPAAVRAAMEPGDTVGFLGAGNVTTAARQLAGALRRERAVSNVSLAEALRALLSPETVCRCEEPMARRTTLRVGGIADCYVEPSSEAELGRVLRFCRERGVPLTVLGRGSNLLVRDGGIRGVVVCLAHDVFSRIEVHGARLLCGAGARLKAVAVEARRRGLAGLEFLEGIPGTVGGALRMNAGAMGSWMFEVVESLRFMGPDGSVEERGAGDVAHSYRQCPLLRDHVALSAVLSGEPASKELIEERLQQFNRKRWESQPAAPSAGCIFKNPESVPAGRLIDELGLKGTCVGGARVSDVHGNFIVNEGSATAADVLRLIEMIQDAARRGRGIALETEVEILGEA
jgi:UDP-N-acetylmuramate--L-alanine ligase/UDP-N-acetylenolpyruvoylglucosamine reductase